MVLIPVMLGFLFRESYTWCDTLASYIQRYIVDSLKNLRVAKMLSWASRSVIFPDGIFLHYFSASLISSRHWGRLGGT